MSEVKAKPAAMAIVKIHPDKGIEVVLQNWEGVSPAMMERVYHQLVVSSQQYRAKKLQEMRIQEHKDSLKEKANVQE